ncbi:hypothetical protein N665_0263s0007 [Sinapis alba]|nr:hypothetical protein N665_0263s0007 [Sinapis alba]
MDVSSSSSRRNQNHNTMNCYRGLPAKIDQVWTDKKLGRQFYGCVHFKDGKQCKFFRWLDEEEVVGWPKKSLITAWDKIRQKNKLIAKLTGELSETKSAAHVKKLDVSTTNMEGESSESASSVHDQDDGSMARLLWNMHRLSVLEDHKSKFPVGVSRIFKNVTSCEIFEEFGCDELLIVRIDVCCCVFFYVQST